MKKTYLLLTPFIFIVLMFTSCKEKADNLTVTYEVTTDKGNFDITYIDESGNKAKTTVSSKNWEKSFIGKKNDSVSLSIMANNINDKIVAKIIYDGKIIEEITIYGKFSDEYIKANISTTLPY